MKALRLTLLTIGLLVLQQSIVDAGRMPELLPDVAMAEQAERADFVGLVECEVAGGLFAKFKVIESFKGAPAETSLLVRHNIVNTGNPYGTFLVGERLFVALVREPALVPVDMAKEPQEIRWLPIEYVIWSAVDSRWPGNGLGARSRNETEHRVRMREFYAMSADSRLLAAFVRGTRQYCGIDPTRASLCERVSAAKTPNEARQAILSELAAVEEDAGILSALVARLADDGTKALVARQTWREKDEQRRQDLLQWIDDVRNAVNPQSEGPLEPISGWPRSLVRVSVERETQKAERSGGDDLFARIHASCVEDWRVLSKARRGDAHAMAHILGMVSGFPSGQDETLVVHGQAVALLSNMTVFGEHKDVAARIRDGFWLARDWLPLWQEVKSDAKLFDPWLTYCEQHCVEPPPTSRLHTCHCRGWRGASTVPNGSLGGWWNLRWRPLSVQLCVDSSHRW